MRVSVGVLETGTLELTVNEPGQQQLLREANYANQTKF